MLGVNGGAFQNQLNLACLIVLILCSNRYIHGLIVFSLPLRFALSGF